MPRCDTDPEEAAAAAQPQYIESPLVVPEVRAEDPAVGACNRRLYLIRAHSVWRNVTQVCLIPL